MLENLRNLFRSAASGQEARTDPSSVFRVIYEETPRVVAAHVPGWESVSHSANMFWSTAESIPDFLDAHVEQGHERTPFSFDAVLPERLVHLFTTHTRPPLCSYRHLSPTKSTMTIVFLLLQGRSDGRDVLKYIHEMHSERYASATPEDITSFFGSLLETIVITWAMQGLSSTLNAIYDIVNEGPQGHHARTFGHAGHLEKGMGVEKLLQNIRHSLRASESGHAVLAAGGQPDTIRGHDTYLSLRWAVRFLQTQQPSAWSSLSRVVREEELLHDEFPETLEKVLKGADVSTFARFVPTARACLGKSRKRAVASSAHPFPWERVSYADVSDGFGYSVVHNGRLLPDVYLMTPDWIESVLCNTLRAERHVARRGAERYILGVVHRIWTTSPKKDSNGLKWVSEYNRSQYRVLVASWLNELYSQVSGALEMEDERTRSKEAWSIFEKEAYSLLRRTCQVFGSDIPPLYQEGGVDTAERDSAVEGRYGGAASPSEDSVSDVSDTEEDLDARDVCGQTDHSHSLHASEYSDAFRSLATYIGGVVERGAALFAREESEDSDIPDDLLRALPAPHQSATHLPTSLKSHRTPDTVSGKFCRLGEELAESFEEVHCGWGVSAGTIESRLRHSSSDAWGRSTEKRMFDWTSDSAIRIREKVGSLFDDGTTEEPRDLNRMAHVAAKLLETLRDMNDAGRSVWNSHSRFVRHTDKRESFFVRTRVLGLNGRVRAVQNLLVEFVGKMCSPPDSEGRTVRVLRGTDSLSVFMSSVLQALSGTPPPPQNPSDAYRREYLMEQSAERTQASAGYFFECPAFRWQKAPRKPERGRSSYSNAFSPKKRDSILEAWVIKKESAEYRQAMSIKPSEWDQEAIRKRVSMLPSHSSLRSPSMGRLLHSRWLSRASHASALYNAYAKKYGIASDTEPFRHTWDGERAREHRAVVYAMAASVNYVVPDHIVRDTRGSLASAYSLFVLIGSRLDGAKAAAVLVRDLEREGKTHEAIHESRTTVRAFLSRPAVRNMLSVISLSYFPHPGFISLLSGKRLREGVDLRNMEHEQLWHVAQTFKGYVPCWTDDILYTTEHDILAQEREFMVEFQRHAYSETAPYRTEQEDEFVSEVRRYASTVHGSAFAFDVTRALNFAPSNMDSFPVSSLETIFRCWYILRAEGVAPRDSPWHRFELSQENIDAFVSALEEVLARTFSVVRLNESGGPMKVEDFNSMTGPTQVHLLREIMKRNPRPSVVRQGSAFVFGQKIDISLLAAKDPGRSKEVVESVRKRWSEPTAIANSSAWKYVTAMHNAWDRVGPSSNKELVSTFRDKVVRVYSDRSEGKKSLQKVVTALSNLIHGGPYLLQRIDENEDRYIPDSTLNALNTVFKNWGAVEELEHAKQHAQERFAHLDRIMEQASLHMRSVKNNQGVLALHAELASLQEQYIRLSHQHNHKKRELEQLNSTLMDQAAFDSFRRVTFQSENLSRQITALGNQMNHTRYKLEHIKKATGYEDAEKAFRDSEKERKREGDARRVHAETSNKVLEELFSAGTYLSDSDISRILGPSAAQGIHRILEKAKHVREQLVGPEITQPLPREQPQAVQQFSSAPDLKTPTVVTSVPLPHDSGIGSREYYEEGLFAALDHVSGAEGHAHAEFVDEEDSSDVANEIGVSSEKESDCGSSTRRHSHEEDGVWKCCAALKDRTPVSLEDSCQALTELVRTAGVPAGSKRNSIGGRPKVHPRFRGEHEGGERNIRDFGARHVYDQIRKEVEDWDLHASLKSEHPKDRTWRELVDTVFSNIEAFSGYEWDSVPVLDSEGDLSDVDGAVMTYTVVQEASSLLKAFSKRGTSSELDPNMETRLRALFLAHLSTGKKPRGNNLQIESEDDVFEFNFEKFRDWFLRKNQAKRLNTLNATVSRYLVLDVSKMVDFSTKGQSKSAGLFSPSIDQLYEGYWGVRMKTLSVLSEQSLGVAHVMRNLGVPFGINEDVSRALRNATHATHVNIVTCIAFDECRSNLIRRKEYCTDNHDEVILSLKKQVVYSLNSRVTAMFSVREHMFELFAAAWKMSRELLIGCEEHEEDIDIPSREAISAMVNSRKRGYEHYEMCEYVVQVATNRLRTQFPSAWKNEPAFAVPLTWDQVIELVTECSRDSGFFGIHFNSERSIPLKEECEEYNNTLLYIAKELVGSRNHVNTSSSVRDIQVGARRTFVESSHYWRSRAVFEAMADLDYILSTKKVYKEGVPEEKRINQETRDVLTARLVAQYAYRVDMNILLKCIEPYYMGCSETNSWCTTGRIGLLETIMTRFPYLNHVFQSDPQSVVMIRSLKERQHTYWHILSKERTCHALSHSTARWLARRGMFIGGNAVLERVKIAPYLDIWDSFPIKARQTRIALRAYGVTNLSARSKIKGTNDILTEDVLEYVKQAQHADRVGLVAYESGLQDTLKALQHLSEKEGDGTDIVRVGMWNNEKTTGYATLAENMVKKLDTFSTRANPASAFMLSSGPRVGT